jgi:hypothetical protein
MLFFIAHCIYVGFRSQVVHSAEKAAGFGSAAEGNVVRLPACTTAHPVGALCFSMDGSQLLSGGQEGVLVSASAMYA